MKCNTFPLFAGMSGDASYFLVKNCRADESSGRSALLSAASAMSFS
jgi:hypothetical protein